MRSSVAARLRGLAALILAFLLALTCLPPAALAAPNDEGHDLDSEVAVTSAGGISDGEAADTVGPAIDATAEDDSASNAASNVPAAIAAASSRTYVLPADTLSRFSVATIATGTVELASGAEGEASIPVLSTIYVAEGCVYTFDETTVEFALVNAVNAELSEEGCLIVPAALRLEGVSCPVTAIAAGALSGSTVTAVALSKNVSSIDADALAEAEKLQSVYVSPDNEVYASYDGCLYDSQLTRLLLVPEGKLGAVRIYSGAEEVDPGAFSHCASVDSLSVDAGSAAFQALADVEILNAEDEPIEVVVSEAVRQTPVEVGSFEMSSNKDDSATSSSPIAPDESLSLFGALEEVEVSERQQPRGRESFIGPAMVPGLESTKADNLVIDIAAFDRQPEKTSIASSTCNSQISVRTVALTDGNIATQNDDSIFHMELMDDGSGFFLDYIDAAASGDIVIPEVWTQNGKTLPVVRIDSWALCSGERLGEHANNVTSLHIPATVSSIGEEHPFGWTSGRKLASITVDDVNAAYASVDGVLFSKDMTNLVFYPPMKTESNYSIPASVTQINRAAITRCFSLQSLVVPPSLSQNLGGKVLLDACTNVSDIHILGTTDPLLRSNILVSMDPNLVTVHLFNWTSEEIAIWTGAGFPVANVVQGDPPFTFELNDEGTGFGLKTVNTALSGGVAIPSEWTQDGLTLPVVSIGGYAFAGGYHGGDQATKVTSVHIPASVTSIADSYPFGWYGISIASVTVDEANPNYASVNGVLYDKDITKLLFYPFAKPDESFTAPSTLTDFRHAAFTRCKYLHAVTLSSSLLETLGTIDGEKVLFDACVALTDIFVDGSTPTSMGGDWFKFASKDNVKVHLLNYVESEINTWVNAGFQIENIDKYGTDFTFAEDTALGGFVLVAVAQTASGAVVIPSQWTQDGKTLPVVGVGPYAFSGGPDKNVSDAVNVTSIRIPNTITWISSSYPFGWRAQRQLREIEVDLGNSAFCAVDGVLFSKDKTELVHYPANKPELSYSVPQGTKEAREGSFVRCLNLSTVVFPSSYSRNLANQGTFDANAFMTDIYVEGVTASTLGAKLVFGVDKSKYTIHLAHYTSETIQLWVDAGFTLEKIVPYRVTTSYQVVFDSQAGDPQPDIQQILYGDLATEPIRPVRTGYDFAGWYSIDLERNWNFTTDAVDGDVTLVAQWIPHVSTLRLYIGESADFADGENALEIKNDEKGRYVDYEVIYGEIFELPRLKYAGYRLFAWTDEEGMTVRDLYGEILVNGGPVRNISAENGALIVYLADWQPVYCVDVPISVNIGVTADFTVNDVLVANGRGLFKNYSEGAIEIVGVEDLADGSGIRTVLPSGIHEKASLTVRPATIVESGDESRLVRLALSGAASVSKDDPAWNATLVIPSASSAGGFIEGEAIDAVPGGLEVSYGLEIPGAAPIDIALLDNSVAIAQLMYTVQFAGERQSSNSRFTQ